MILSLFLASPRAERHLLVMAGQSNMVGTASFAEGGIPDSIPGVLVWNAFGDRSGQWHPMTHGYSFDTTTFGPEWTLVQRLIGKLPQDTFAVVKVALGATSLEEHWRSPSSGEPAGPFYQVLLDAVDSARRCHPAGEMPLSGFFWMQGESDALEEVAANLYRERLEAFIVDLGREWSDTSMPWILGLIDVQPTWPWASVVREGTMAAAEALQRVALVETIGLPTDGVHYTAEGTKRLGTLFADRWLVEKGWIPTGTPERGLEIRRIPGKRMLISVSGRDPIQEVRMMGLEGWVGPWIPVGHSLILSATSGRSSIRRGINLLQLRRRSGRMEAVQALWP